MGLCCSERHLTRLDVYGLRIDGIFVRVAASYALLVNAMKYLPYYKMMNEVIKVASNDSNSNDNVKGSGGKGTGDPGHGSKGSGSTGTGGSKPDTTRRGGAGSGPGR